MMRNDPISGPDQAGFRSPDLPPLESVALRRLVEEVRAGDPFGATLYNRTYHRHNR